MAAVNRIPGLANQTGGAGWRFFPGRVVREKGLFSFAWVCDQTGYFFLSGDAKDGISRPSLIGFAFYGAGRRIYPVESRFQ